MTFYLLIVIHLGYHVATETIDMPTMDICRREATLTKERLKSLPHYVTAVCGSRMPTP